jgi:hypothetical protein
MCGWSLAIAPAGCGGFRLGRLDHDVRVCRHFRIGFAAVNVSDVTMARSSRSTPAITTAQATLADATAARDPECRSGAGKFCRELEAIVEQQRLSLGNAIGTVAQTADPQSEAAIKIVAWISRGAIEPVADDFGSGLPSCRCCHRSAACCS